MITLFFQADPYSIDFANSLEIVFLRPAAPIPTAPRFKCPKDNPTASIAEYEHTRRMNSIGQVDDSIHKLRFLVSLTDCDKMLLLNPVPVQLDNVVPATNSETRLPVAINSG